MQIPIVNQQQFQSSEEHIYEVPQKSVQRKEVFLYTYNRLIAVWFIWIHGNGYVWK